MKKLGNQTYKLEKNCYILGKSALVGNKEKFGPFGKYLKNVVEDDKMGEDTFEKGERRMLSKINDLAIKDSKLKVEDINLYLGGDLMNQIVSSNYSAEKLQIPFVGIYSACATLTASLGLAACLIESGAFSNILCSTISHFSSAERQYRYPLEFGNQRQCYSQWTVTGGGGFVLSTKPTNIIISKVCFGRVQDFGVVDIANMGAAMAPAACDTLCNFFDDTNSKPNDYDLIATGDLGKLGSDILRDLLEEKGYILEQNYLDIGHSIYSFDEESYQGGSGAGCSACILASYILENMRDRKFKKVLVVATGALMSTVSNQQGDAIPAVAHLIEINVVWGGCMFAALFMYVKVFVVGGLICMIGELIEIKTKITPARILVLFLMAGAILGGFGVYNYLIEFAGAGATLPITGFGNALARGAIEGAESNGLFGAIGGGLMATSAGVAVSIGLSYMISFFVSSKSKKN